MTLTQPIFNKVVVFGVGLIGGSFALALKAAGGAKEIVGVGRNPVNLQRALDLGVITQQEMDPAQAVVDADLVLLAMPVGQMQNVMQTIAPHLARSTVVTDAGSTKQDVVRLALQYLPNHLAGFVPAHPIAGAENSGVDAARVDLFHGRNLIMTPLAETTDAAVESVRSAWQLCGMTVRQLSAAMHDQIFAAVSHLPHVLAFALVEALAARPNAEDFFRYAGSGFRDFTRIASSSPEMWRDICLANRDALIQELENYQDELQQLRRMILDGDGDGLEKMFERARTARNDWLAQNDKK